MKIYKIFLSLILLLSVVDTVGAVTIDETLLMYADHFTLHTLHEETYTFIEGDGLTYWHFTPGGNITFVSGMTTEHTIIERDGHHGIGNYSTHLICNVYSPDDWTTSVYMRIRAGDGSLILNQSMSILGAGINKTASYNFIPNIFSLPVSKMGYFDVDIYATSYNTTLTWYGNRSWDNLFRVYHLDDPWGYTVSTNVSAPSSVNFTWHEGNNSDRTVIIRTNSSVNANHPSDGYEVYNGTNTWFNDTITSGELKSFTAFSYNSTTHSYSMPLDLLWGALRIQVFNETSPWMPVVNYGLLISNRTGTDTYYNESCDNPVLLDIFSIPFGDNTVFKFNKTNYQVLITYSDIIPNTFYNLTFYMSPVAFSNPDEPYNVSESHLYRLRVVDGISYQADPVADVTVTITRYINTTGHYETKAIVLTNTYGEADVNLMGNTYYKVKLEKTGYTTVEGEDWFTDPLFWGPNYPAVFMIPIDIQFDEVKTFWEYSTYAGSLHGNNTLNVIFIDSLCDTTNMLFNIYEEYNGTLIFIDQVISVDSCGYSFWVNISNSSRAHKVLLNLTHDEYGTVSEWITVNPWVNTSSNDARKQWIEDTSSAIFGSFPPGYVNFFIFFIPALLALLIPGNKHLELGIVLVGLVLGFISIKISMPNVMVALIPFIILIGFLYGLAKRRGEKL